jgi:hypothetical protein
MSYYNYVLVIFTKSIPGLEQVKLDARTAGQMLPAGSIPLAIANENNSEITEIINSVESEKIIEFVDNCLQETYNNSNAHSDTYIEYQKPNWKYIYS